MRSLKIRTRITIVVAVVAAVALAVLAFAAAGTVNENVTVNTLESTGDALAESEVVLDDYLNDVHIFLDEGAAAAAAGIFSEGSSPPAPPEGTELSILDETGAPVLLSDLWADPPGVELAVVGRVVCRAVSATVSCDSEVETPERYDAAGRELERLVDATAGRARGEAPSVTMGEVVSIGSTPILLVATRTVESGIESVVSGGAALVIIPVLVLVVGAILWFALGRALGPVDAITAQVERIGGDNLDQRVAVPAAKDELHHLATTMNKMLDRLQHSQESQRQFISDASHELRSPITATQATLEVARAGAITDWDGVADVLAEENERLARLVDDLLLLARLDEQRVATAADTVDLDELCLVEAARPRPVEVMARVHAPARVQGNLAMLTRAVRNLVDNAAAHAESSVTIDVDLVEAQAVVRVSDDGTGVRPEHRDLVFDRFTRVEESRARDEGGAGLGLAIVRKVAEAHQGTVQLEDAPTGGATFTLSLPASK